MPSLAELDEKLRDPVLGKKFLSRIISRAEALAGRLGRRPVFMEVCGTHTEAISRSGLRSLLRKTADLRSGPGCPVCVTAEEDIEAVINLARLPGIVVATFGDLVRVPGAFSSLEEERARGARVQVVYSPAQALDLAGAGPGREVVFLGAGFETTAPLTAVCLKEARRRGIKNFSVFSLHKLIPPALVALLGDSGTAPDGLLLPGHVSAVIGRAAYDFLARDYGVPAVVTGFEPLDILEGIWLLLEMLEKGRPEVKNAYPRAVREKGNPRAQAVLEECFEPGPAAWRGLGEIPGSGLHLKGEYRTGDARARFPLPRPQARAGAGAKTGCRCGELLRGRLTPPECPLFGRSCTPVRPAGPCMVSSEGACAAYYRYERSGSTFSGL